jgi:hypothetical protein
MTTSTKSICAAFLILSTVSCVAMGTVFTDATWAASKNFAAKCERVMGNNVKALAIEPTYSYQELCVCARTNPELRKQIGAAGIKCNESTITNFNQATIAPPGEPPSGPPPGPEPTLNGNNGWGNGGEGINAGSDNGNVTQSGPKSADKNGQGLR